MKLIEATWELRNLGVTCQELIVDDSHALDLVAEQIRNLTASYQVLKLSCSRFDLMNHVQEAGFRFVELLYHAKHDLNLPEVTGIQLRMSRVVDYVQANETLAEEIIEQVESSQMFETDRISIDPRFGVQKAAHRYACWLRDEIDRGSLLYAVTLKDGVTGFFLLRMEGDLDCRGLLAGIFPAYQGRGLGFFMSYLQLFAARQLGAGRYLSTYSSNNVAIGRLHNELGFNYEGSEYVFVRHT
ncbi:MAG: hypothetical protein RL594_792 [Bacteroidota bacterium]|jgi:GNAT superfamily N-acetyltransferase